MISEIKVKADNALSLLGIPSANIPKYKIGDIVKHTFSLDDHIVIEQVGRVTALLVYETKPGNPNTVVTNYTYIVSVSSHHAFMVGEEDSADESELELA